jgi:hypothetical protein
MHLRKYLLAMLSSKFYDINLTVTKTIQYVNVNMPVCQCQYVTDKTILYVDLY